MAAVARDSNGNVLGASALTIAGATEPEMLEAVACREGLALASVLYLQRIRLASDCNNVVRSFREDFLTFEVVHENRSTNVDAHRLARSSVYASLGRHVWFTDTSAGL